MYSVYVITNTLNQKNYVGLTSQKYVSDRWKKHMFCARKGTDTHFYRAIRKYGPESFIKDVVASGINQAEAQRLERFWIGLLCANQKEFGYNTTHGGYAPQHTEETRAKISFIQTGRQITPEALINLRASLHTPEYHEKRSIISKRIANSESWKEKVSGDNHWTRRQEITAKMLASRSEGQKRAYREGRHVPWNKGLPGTMLRKHQSPEARQKMSAFWKNRFLKTIAWG
jgi:group I intron endonuclease